MTLRVIYSLAAAAQIASLRAEGEAKPEKMQGARWRAVRHILVEYLPDHGLAPSDRKEGDIVGLRAKRAGDRDRVVWIASAEKQTVAVLSVGYRKDGDKHDVYKVLRKELARGTFDDQFAELGIPKPGEIEPPAQSTPPSTPVGGRGEGEPQE